MAQERHTITGAICRQADGSRTDGVRKIQLPSPVMRSDVNLPVADHPEVASDTDSFTRLFLTDYCKALSRAFNCKCEFHKNEFLKSESKERLEIEYTIRFLSKTGHSFLSKPNTLLYSKHESLPLSTKNRLTLANI